jgi:hypothetical protein
VVLFIVLAIAVYMPIRIYATTVAVGFMDNGNYESALTFAIIELVLREAPLVVFGGGIFFAAASGAVSAQMAGLESDEEEVKSTRPLKMLFQGFLVPIGAAIALIALYAIIGFITVLGEVNLVLAALGELGNINLTIYMFITYVGSFLIATYSLYLIATIPACGLSTFIVSLVTLPYLRKKSKEKKSKPIKSREARTGETSQEKSWAEQLEDKERIQGEIASCN